MKPKQKICSYMDSKDIAIVPLPCEMTRDERKKLCLKDEDKWHISGPHSVGDPLTSFERPVKPAKPKRISEAAVCWQLAKDTSGRTEVICATGKIDILTDTEIIEVKRWCHWKHALGQLLAYKACYPNRNMRAHFFSKRTKIYNFVVNFLTHYGIRVTEYDGNWVCHDVIHVDGGDV